MTTRSPYWCSAGVAQGRIQPRFATPTHGLWDFCLGYDGGEDREPEFMLNVGEEIKIEQAADLTGIKLINFAWTMRTPSTLPVAETLVNAGAVRFKTGDLFSTGDGCRGIQLPVAVLTERHRDQLFAISGSAAPANNGIFRVSAVSALGVVNDYKRAVLENAALVATGLELGITVKAYGACWRASAYVNGVKRVELVEAAEHDVARSLTMHVAQVGVAGLISFRLALESVVP